MMKTLWFFLGWFFCSSIFAGYNDLPQGSGVPVLLYHGVVKERDPTQIYHISIEELRGHLSALKKTGYVSINTKDLLAYFRGDKALPKKAIMITFDDARKDSFKNSDPILEEFGFQAVMFVTTLMQEKKYPLYLSWKQLKQMHDSGRWDIQAHGYELHNLIPVNEEGERGSFGSNRLWLKEEERLETMDEYKKRLHTDLVRQKEDIETHVEGAKVIAIAYPFGDWGQGTKNIDPALAIAINYQVGNQVFPLSFGDVVFVPANYKITTTPHLITRFMDNGTYSPQELLEILKNAYN